MKYLFFLFISAVTVVSCNKTPVASFQASKTECRVPCAVDFINTSQNSKEAIWNFGDGSMSTEDSPSHVFNEPGNYTVSLEAINGGNSDVANKTIKVRPEVTLKLNSVHKDYSDFMDGINPMAGDLRQGNVIITPTSIDGYLLLEGEGINSNSLTVANVVYDHSIWGFSPIQIDLTQNTLTPTDSGLLIYTQIPVNISDSANYFNSLVWSIDIDVEYNNKPYSLDTNYTTSDWLSY